MHALRYQDPALFAPVARRLIEQQPASCSVLATHLSLQLSGRSPSTASTCWYVVMDGDRPIGLAMHTPPFHLFMSPLDTDDPAGAVAELAGAAGRGQPVSGVHGPAVEAGLFADRWLRDHGGGAVPVMDEVLYELEEPPPPPAVPGTARRAAEDDDWVVAWLHDFHTETLPDQPHPLPGKEFRRRLNTGALVLWEDGGRPVALAGVTLTDPPVSRIGPVYVPAADRGRGYGKAVTATAARLAFEHGAEACSLYADTGNPTSNAVYRGLGFRVVSRWRAIGFSPGARPAVPAARDGS